MLSSGFGDIILGMIILEGIILQWEPPITEDICVYTCSLCIRICLRFPFSMSACVNRLCLACGWHNLCHPQLGSRWKSHQILPHFKQTCICLISYVNPLCSLSLSLFLFHSIFLFFPLTLCLSISLLPSLSPSLCHCVCLQLAHIIALVEASPHHQLLHR